MKAKWREIKSKWCGKPSLAYSNEWAYSTISSKFVNIITLEINFRINLRFSSHYLVDINEDKDVYIKKDKAIRDLC